MFAPCAEISAKCVSLEGIGCRSEAAPADNDTNPKTAERNTNVFIFVSIAVPMMDLVTLIEGLSLPLLIHQFLFVVLASL